MFAVVSGGVVRLVIMIVKKINRKLKFSQFSPRDLAKDGANSKCRIGRVSPSRFE